MTSHELFMREALREAAADDGEVPVGAVIVRDNQIVARAHNERESAPARGNHVDEILQCGGGDCQAFSRGGLFAHAEMLAMTRAREALSARDLQGCALYVTLEPCAMCAGAILLARLDKCVFGAFDPNKGCCGSVYHLPDDPKLGGGIPCFGGVLEEECRALLDAFFSGLRGRRRVVAKP